jgi:hypothetical protein
MATRRGSVDSALHDVERKTEGWDALRGPPREHVL